MVVSLYVCEIPENVTKEQLIGLFCEIEGYIETRTKIANDKRTIAFIDYQTERDAICAKDTLQGFKFSDRDRGLIIKLSEYTKSGLSQNINTQSYNNRKALGGKRLRSSSGSEPKNINPQESQINKKTNLSPKNTNKIINQGNNDILQKNLIKLLESSNNTNANNNLSSNNIPLNLINNTNLLDMPKFQSQQNTLLNNLTALQLLLRANSNQDNRDNMMNSQNSPNNKNKMDYFLQLDDDFFDFEDFTPNATNIVYVEGIPLNATEREIAHIFRPFPGFQNIRIVPKEKNGKKTIICFVDFENIAQSTLCIRTLQGYRFDKNDVVGLHFSYGVSKGNKK